MQFKAKRKVFLMFLKAKQQLEKFIALVSKLKTIKSGNVDALLV